MNEKDVYFESIFMSNLSESIISVFSKGIYPIYGDGTNKKPYHIGSCFIVGDSENKYLITASHIIEHYRYKRTTLYIGLGKLLEVIGDVSFTINNQGKDKIDIAIVKLRKSYYGDFWYKIKSLSLEFLDINKKYEYNGAAILGYPNSKNKISINNFTKTAVCYINLIIKYSDNPELFSLVKADDESHLIIKYDKTMTNKNGNQNAIHPSGMSGGPLVLINITNNLFGFHDLNIFIGGVIIEYHKKHRVIIATKTEKILGVLSRLTH